MNRRMNLFPRRIAAWRSENRHIKSLLFSSLIYLGGCYKRQFHFFITQDSLFERIVRTLEPRGGKTLRRYEILFIAHANSSDDQLNELIERYKSIITNLKGIIVKIDKWGTRKLTYEIKKQTKGIYVLIDFAGKSAIVPELERNFKIDDNILKFLTVVKDKEVDPQELEKEIKGEVPPESKIASPKADSPETSSEAVATEQPAEGESTGDTKEENE
jgi:small subunit ribosomal protein S6